MNKGEYIIVERWNGTGYLPYLGIITDVGVNNQLDAMHSDGQGAIDKVEALPDDESATEGEDFWRPYSGDLVQKNPLLGQPVWVSYAREEKNSKIVRGIILSNFGAGFGDNLRVAFHYRRTRIRTCVPQAMAFPCDNFWAVEEPTPVYCDDD